MKKKPWRYYLTYLWTGPADVLVWLIVLVIWLLWGTKLQWVGGGLWCELKPNSWPTMSWYRYKVDGVPLRNTVDKQPFLGMYRTWAGTTLGHGGFYGPGRTQGPGIDTEVEFHENFHVEQHEAAMLLTFILGIIVVLEAVFISHTPNSGCIIGAGVWIIGGYFSYICAGIQAWLRGEKFYRGNVKEEGAYAVAADYIRKD